MAPGTPSNKGPELSDYRHIFQRPTWHGLGACHGKPLELWFSNKQSDRDIAQTICSQVCPVRWQCLADNIEVPVGIFGGFNAEQRKFIREQTPVVIDPVLLRLLNEVRNKSA